MTTVSLAILTDFKNSLENLIEFGQLYFDQILIIAHDSKANRFGQKYLKTKKVKLIKHDVISDFSQIRNLAQQQATTDYLFFVDDDEEVVVKDQVSFRRFLGELKREVYMIKRYEEFLGQVIKYGESIFHARLVKKKVIWEGKVHERPVSLSVAKINGVFLIHRQKLEVFDFINKLNYYSSLRAWDLNSTGSTGSIIRFFLYPPAKFCQDYLFRRGFLAGWRGLWQAFLMSYYSLMVQVKLYLIRIKR